MIRSKQTATLDRRVLSHRTSTMIALAALTALPLASLSNATESGASAGTALRFDRPAKAGLAVTTSETHDLVLQSLTTQFGEEDAVEQPTSMRLRSRADVAVIDEAADAGAVRRRYVAGEATLQIMDPSAVNEEEGTWQGFEIKLGTPVQDLSVVFVPAEAQPEGFGRHFDATPLRETVLPQLSAPADWGAFLPKAAADGERAELELGDEWKLDPMALEPILAPSGFMGWRPGEEAVSDPQILRAFTSGVGGNLQLAFDGTVTGTASARLDTVGVDPDVGRYADITLKFDLAMRADRDAFVDDRRMESEGEMDVEMLGAQLSVALEGEGSIRWSLEQQRPVGGIVAARENVTMTVRVMPQSGDQQGQVVSQTIHMKGSIVNNLKCRTVALSPVKRTIVEGK